MHVTRQGDGKALAEEDGSIGREPDQSIRNRYRVQRSGLEVPYEQIRGPHPLELVVIKRNAVISKRKVIVYRQLLSLFS